MPSKSVKKIILGFFIKVSGYGMAAVSCTGASTGGRWIEQADQEYQLIEPFERTAINVWRENGTWENIERNRRMVGCGADLGSTR